MTLCCSWLLGQGTQLISMKRMNKKMLKKWHVEEVGYVGDLWYLGTFAG